jgi:Glucodextranase, domain B
MQLVLKGTVSEPVNLTVNGRIVALKDDGTFSFATTLTEGINTFEVIAVDLAGNEAKESVSFNFHTS